MTDIEKKALALVNEVMPEDCPRMAMRPDEANQAITFKALCRAIEQHEAFRQEVSDAITRFDEYGTEAAWERLSRFIIAKPDPLVEVLRDMGYSKNADVADDFRAALAARGLEIREKQP